MEETLQELFKECKGELQSIGIDLEDKKIGKIDIHLSKRNNKRYGCCKQENPVYTTKRIEIRGHKKTIRYDNHHIEISPWVMLLEKNIIKNTIMHEMIHCLPYCNNHGVEFKRYAHEINKKLGYTISRVGNKEEDFKKSNISFKQKETYHYKILCEKCKQTFYRKRISKEFTRKYRCGTCGGKFIIEYL